MRENSISENLRFENPISIRAFSSGAGRQQKLAATETRVSDQRRPHRCACTQHCSTAKSQNQLTEIRAIPVCIQSNEAPNQTSLKEFLTFLLFFCCAFANSFPFVTYFFSLYFALRLRFASLQAWPFDGTQQQLKFVYQHFYDRHL